MAENTRTPRANETREEKARPNPSWVPASILPDPDPREGLVHRWIATSSGGKSDNLNVSKKFREGWEACLASDYPELMVMSDRGSTFKGNIEIGGLLLCKASAKLMSQRRAYYQQKAETQMESVDATFMGQNDPRMPVLEPDRKTRKSSFAN